jgi:hypothetical protein
MIIIDKSRNKTITGSSMLINNAAPNILMGYKSSQFVIPFLLSIYNVQPSNLTKSVSRTIVSLDNLAQVVDSKLDSPNSYGKNVSTSSFANLEKQILECFSPLNGIINIEDLYADTLKAVNVSFELNVLKRQEVYSLQDCNSFLGCTMYYALPLVNFLNTVYSPSEIRKSYCLLSNFIQAVDDFADIFQDLSEGILTPVTTRYSSYQSQNAPDVLLAVQNDVLNFLEATLSELTIEIYQVSKKDNNLFIAELKKFVGDFRKMELPANNRDQQERYLLKMVDITPPILCYTAN